MPIRREHRWLYPIDWQQLTDLVRFRRAQGKCEQCCRPHGEIIYHLGDGRWWCGESTRWRDGNGRSLRLRTPPSPSDKSLRTTRVFLATAHLDHDPTNNAMRNLKALCQRCHMLHDRPEHLRRRKLNFLMTRAIGDLFTGRYTG